MRKLNKIKRLLTLFHLKIFECLKSFINRLKIFFSLLSRFFFFRFIIRILFLGTLNGFISYYLWGNLDLNMFIKSCIIILIISPSIFYIHNIYSYWKSNSICQTNKPKEEKGNKLLLKNKHFVGLLSLLVFYSGILVALEYFKGTSYLLSIPDLKSGTVGFRAWRSKVKFENIKIMYLNSNSVWIKVPDTIVWNPNNWVFPVWVDTIKGMEIPKKIADSFDYCSNAYLKNNKDSMYFELKNCGAVFYPKDEICIKNYKNVRLDVIITFLETDNSVNVFPGIALCTRIDTTKIAKYQYSNRGKINYMFSDLCIEFIFPFKDYAHPWIPALDWQPSVIQRSSILDLEKYGKLGRKNKEKGTKYKISAFIFNKQVRFSSHDFGTASLYEAKIEESIISK